MLARTLHAMRSYESFPLFRDSLAVAGKDGTLADRFRREFPALTGQVFAKTGSIRGVSSLSGYVQRGDRLWTFALVFNGLGGRLGDARRLQERIVDRLWKALGS